MGRRLKILEGGWEMGVPGATSRASGGPKRPKRARIARNGARIAHKVLPGRDREVEVLRFLRVVMVGTLSVFPRFAIMVEDSICVPFCQGQR